MSRGPGDGRRRRLGLGPPPAAPPLRPSFPGSDQARGAPSDLPWPRGGRGRSLPPPSPAPGLRSVRRLPSAGATGRQRPPPLAPVRPSFFPPLPELPRTHPLTEESHGALSAILHPVTAGALPPPPVRGCRPPTSPPLLPVVAAGRPLVRGGRPPHRRGGCGSGRSSRSSRGRGAGRHGNRHEVRGNKNEGKGRAIRCGKRAEDCRGPYLSTGGRWRCVPVAFRLRAQNLGR